MMRASLFLAIVPLMGGCLLVRHTDDLSGGRRPDAGTSDTGAGDDDDGATPGGAVVFAGGRDTPTAITWSGGVIYWTENNAVVAAGPAGDTRVAVDLDVTPQSVFVSQKDGYIVWSSADGGAVGSCPAGQQNGCTYRQGNADPGSSLVASGFDDVDSPMAAVNDGTNYFWVNRSNGAYAVCESAPCDADSVNEARRGEDQPWAMAKSDSYIFWVDKGGTIMRGDVDADDSGDYQSRPLKGGQASPIAIAELGGIVYWANSGDGTIRSTPADGGDETTLVDGQDGIHSIAVDNSGIYWTTYGESGSVSTCALTGCGADGPHVLASGQKDAYGVAVGTDTVYWTVSGAVMKIAKPQ